MNEEQGSLKLLVNGSRQSGPYIGMLWKKAFGNFSGAMPFQVKKILVLGVGGGTVIRMLHSMYPDARISAVDIDPVILGIARTYFRLDALPGLTLIEEDAGKFLRSSVSGKKEYDIVILDIFIGADIPDMVLSAGFLDDLRCVTRSVFLANYLYEFRYVGQSRILERELGKRFPRVLDFPIRNNRFFLASKAPASPSDL
ncbi:hypothetical protein M1555_00775 [Patescibacteria group bacterium]|nr:hypothetical protein [Patescibacteria group bacterium]